MSYETLKARHERDGRLLRRLENMRRRWDRFEGERPGILSDAMAKLRGGSDD